MEQIYNDFTKNMLPKIQEGLVIGRDYFQDLFGRYVHYLLITDIMWTVLFSILLLAVIIPSYKYRQEILEETQGMAFMFIAFFSITFMIGIMVNLFDCIKDIYIPEIRVIEIMQEYKR